VDSGGSEVSIAKKLRQVVAANFIEIVRPDEPAAPAAERSNSGTTAESLSPFSGGYSARVPLTPELTVEDGGADSPLAESRESVAEAETPFRTEAVAETATEVVEAAEAEAEQPAGPEEDSPFEASFLMMAEADRAELEAAEAADERSTPSPTPLTLSEAAAPAAAASSERMDRYSAGYDPLPLLGTGGAVDFERLMREANLPPVRFSAEQASKILSALPEDLPMRVKRMTVKATLDAVDPTAAIAPEDVVADAMLKKMHIAQYREALGDKVAEQRAAIEAEIARTRAEIEAAIARMEREIVRRQEAIAALELTKHRAAEECGKRIQQMEQVVLFFQAEAVAADPATPVANIATATAAAPSAPESEDELPPFMRDEAIYRLLGMDEKDAKAAEDESSEGGEERGRRSRRKVALNGTGEDEP
jgi:hypothetical protein